MFVVERFAQFADRLRGEPLPAPVVHHAKRAVVDWHAALFPGAVIAPATLLERVLADELDRGGATLALGRRATVRAAALVNGTAAHAIEFDDIFRDAIYHPGAPTIAAALAVAQDRAASGEEFLRASWPATRSRRASARPWAGRIIVTGTRRARLSLLFFHGIMQKHPDKH